MSAYIISNIEKSFGSLKVLEHIDAVFARSSVTAILGPSGSGKTTLLNIIAGLLKPDSGSIGEFSEAGFSYSFQEPRLLPWMNSLENILFAMSSIADKDYCRERAHRFLRTSGLGAFENARPRELSGGMKRRLSLARAFSYPSDVLLLDEAFSAVDLKIRIELMDLFSLLWQEEKRTTIFVTHDVQDALYLADSIILFSPRPAHVIESLAIAMPRERRTYGSKDFLVLEEQLYKQILS